MRSPQTTLSTPADALPTGRRYVTASHLVLESHDATHATIVNAATGARIRVSMAAYGILGKFAVPRSIADVFGGHDDGRALARIEALVTRGLLIDSAAPPQRERSRRRVSPYRFCNAPSYSAGGAAADVVVLGVPYDLGGRANGRDGPQAIRQKSLDYTYTVDFATKRPAGWFDAAAGERILAGATIVDADDLPVVVGEAQRTTFERLGSALDELVRERTIPLVLAGDRTVALPVASWLASMQPLSVIQFAEETIAAVRVGEAVTVRDAGRAMAEVDGVVSVATLGLRDAADRIACPNVEECTADESRAVARFDGGGLARADRVLLSVDLGVLGVSVPPTGEGLSLRDVREAIRAIGRHHRIVGVVVAGLDADAPMGTLAAIAGCHIALQATHAALVGRER